MTFTLLILQIKIIMTDIHIIIATKAAGGKTSMSYMISEYLKKLGFEVEIQDDVHPLEKNMELRCKSLIQQNKHKIKIQTKNCNMKLLQPTILE